MTETIDTITADQQETVKDLARRGCSLNEVGTALGFTEVQMSQILENEEHLFCKIYWQAKIEYTKHLRTVALNIAENSTDDAVRARMVEFLAKENHEAFEDKRSHTGFTNIKKLLAIVRQQFSEQKKKQRAVGMPYGSHRSEIRGKIAKEASNGRKK